MRKMYARWGALQHWWRRKFSIQTLVNVSYKPQFHIDRKSAHTCMNCSSALKGPYCHVCGQKDDDLRRPFWTFLRDILDSVFSSDSRLIKSLVLLVLAPGLLGKAYMEGHRAAFVPPLRTYLIMSVFFFLVLGVTDVVLMDIRVTPKALGTQQAHNKPDAVQIHQGIAVNTDLASDAGSALPYDVTFNMFVKPDMTGRISLQDKDVVAILEDETIPQWTKNIIRGGRKALVKPSLMNEVFNKWLPRVLVFIVPVFALMLRMMHWGDKQFYFNQLMFSLQYHTFLFLLMTALIIIVPRFGGEVGSLLFWLGSMIYLFVALKVAQNQSWIKAFMKFCVLWVFYIGVMFAGLLVTISFGLQEI